MPGAGSESSGTGREIIMARKAEVLLLGKVAGFLMENEDGYTFQYAAEYLKKSDAGPVSRLSGAVLQ